MNKLLTNSILGKLFIVILSLIILSCNGCKSDNFNSDKNTKSELKAKLVISSSDSISLNIPSDVNYSFRTNEFYSDSANNYLSLLNNSSNEIIFFCIDSGNLAFRIKLHKQGQNRTGRCLGYKILGKDSIIVTALGIPSLFQIDFKGKVYKRYDYAQTVDNEQVYFFPSFSSFNRRLLLVKGKFYGTQYPKSPWNPSKLSKVPDEKLSLEIDISSGDVKLHDVTIPRDYWDNGKVPLFSSRDCDGERLVWSFSYDHNLYLYDLSGNFIEKKVAKSKYIDKFTALSNNFNGMKYFIETPRYRDIIYDKYRNVYYRFARQGFKLNKNDYIISRFNYPTQFSIIVLDKNFAVIDELLLPKNIYSIKEWFITPKGLYISQNHIESPQFNEDILTFRLFKLVKE